MGHTRGESVCRLPHITHGDTIDSNDVMSRCESCIIGKHLRQPHPTSQSPPPSRFLELIHSNLCSSIPVETPHHKCYFIIFLDDHTGLLALQLLATKDQNLEGWKSVHVRWETRSSLRVITFHSDNGGEFLNDMFTAELQATRIKHQLSTPYAHQQNGRAEQVLHTIEGQMYTMLNNVRLLCNLWGEVALPAAYLFNCTKSHMLPAGKTLYEMLHKVKPDHLHIHVFGVRCFTHIPSDLQEKMGPRSRKAIFMGYAPDGRAWRCCDKATRISSTPEMSYLMKHSLVTHSKLKEKIQTRTMTQ